MDLPLELTGACKWVEGRSFHGSTKCTESAGPYCYIQSECSEVAIHMFCICSRVSGHDKLPCAHVLRSQGPPTAEGTKAITTMKRKKGGRGKKSDGEGTAGEVVVMPFLSQFPLPPEGIQPDSEISTK